VIQIPCHTVDNIEEADCKRVLENVSITRQSEQYFYRLANLKINPGLIGVYLVLLAIVDDLIYSS